MSRPITLGIVSIYPATLTGKISLTDPGAIRHSCPGFTLWLALKCLATPARAYACLQGNPLAVYQNLLHFRLFFLFRRLIQEPLLTTMTLLFYTGYMESYEKEYVSKIKHRINSQKSRQKRTEAIFVFFVIAVIAFLLGYFIGSYFPVGTPSEKDKVWSEGFKKYKEKNATPHRPKVN